MHGRATLRAAAVTPQVLNDAGKSIPLDVVYHEAGRQASSRAEKVAAGVFIALTCLGVFLGMASFFTGITGEKQLRVTEQVVAAISPQTWVDGKLLGLTAAAFGTLLTYGAAMALFFVLLKLSGMDFPIPWAAIRPDKLMLFLLLAVLGIFFWNCVFAAIAVTINDPNSSNPIQLDVSSHDVRGNGFPGIAKAGRAGDASIGGNARYVANRDDGSIGAERGGPVGDDHGRAAAGADNPRAATDRRQGLRGRRSSHGQGIVVVGSVASMRRA